MKTDNFFLSTVSHWYCRRLHSLLCLLSPFLFFCSTYGDAPSWCQRLSLHSSAWSAQWTFSCSTVVREERILKHSSTVKSAHLQNPYLNWLNLLSWDTVIADHYVFHHEGRQDISSNTKLDWRTVYGRISLISNSELWHLNVHYLDDINLKSKRLKKYFTDVEMRAPVNDWTADTMTPPCQGQRRLLYDVNEPQNPRQTRSRWQFGTKTLDDARVTATSSEIINFL